MNNQEIIQQVKLRFGIIGSDEELIRAIDIAIQVAPTDLSVLITGESGVGKESFPQIIHQFSPRKHGRYIAVNCGAIPEGTIDSELFGHEKGAFTGALGERKGYFGEADGGTIFLDEVGEMPLSTQARLLRVLESGEYIRVGSSQVQRTNVRIVAATNVNLVKAISEGRFREDLFYRLSTVPIKVPPLRERGDDLLLIFRKFASDFAATYHMPPIQLTPAARQMMLSYSFPGNVRQLKNITEQISIIEQARDITPEILSRYLPQEHAERLPVLFGQKASSSSQTFESERELLYKILFDMRKDVNDLKQQLHDIARQAPQQKPAPMAPEPAAEPLWAQTSPLQAEPSVVKEETLSEPSQVTQVPHIIRPKSNSTRSGLGSGSDVQDTDVYVEETLSLDENEKDLIRKALEKHRGKRKAAAKDLNISERTLYRKIKEYGLE